MLFEFCNVFHLSPCILTLDIILSHTRTEVFKISTVCCLRSTIVRFVIFGKGQSQCPPDIICDFFGVDMNPDQVSIFYFPR